MTDEITPVQERVRPWRNLGFDVSAAKSAAEAIALADLDWNVIKWPAISNYGDEVRPVPGRYEMRRDTDGRFFGYVAEDYKPFQNREAFEFADALLDSDVRFETAGGLRDDKWIFLTMRLPKQIKVIGEDIDLMLAFTTSHDGSRAITAATTTIRIVCENTFRLALATARTTWSVRHTNTLEGRVAEAKESLKLTYEYGDEFAKEVEELARKKVTQSRFEAIVSDILGGQDKQPRVREKILDLYQTSPTVEKGTAWGALNAVSEYYDWGRNSSPHAHTMNVWTGAVARKTNRALQLLAA